MKKIKFSEMRSMLFEGIYDPNILKAFFVVGGPGSGKSYVSELTFFNGDAYGLKVINSDTVFEIKMDKAFQEYEDEKFDIKKLDVYANDPDVVDLRTKAKRLSGADNYIKPKYGLSKYANAIAGRLGLIIDGTGRNPKKIEQGARFLKSLGYDTYMLFIDVDLETSLKRNTARSRVVPVNIVKNSWHGVNTAKNKYQKMFGNDFILFDNSEYRQPDDPAFQKLEKQIRKLLSQNIKNPIGKRWIRRTRAKYDEMEV